MTGAVRTSRPAPATLAGLFFLALFGFLYWNYLFDGMVLSDSWFLYATDGGEFKWFTRAQLANQEPLPRHDELVSFTPSWSLLSSRRGLMPIAVLVIDRISVGNRRVFVNLLCISVQVLNVLLFAWVIWKLAGPRPLFPILALTLLYPFSSGSHFWQYLIVNNLAVTFFLLSLILFIGLDHSAPRVTRATVLRGGASLVCFWISLLLVEYSIFMGPLFLYLGLYFSNGGVALFRFQRLVTPSSCIGIGFVFLTVLATVLVASEAPSILSYTPRFEELSSRVMLPAQVIGGLTVLGNGLLVYLSVLFSNSLGFLIYPLSMVVQHFGILMELWWVLPGILLVAGVAIVVLRRVTPTHRMDVEAPHEHHRIRFLFTLAGLWVVLAYLPFAASFGYPRVVGLTADRANILAMWGVSIVVGAFMGHMLERVAERDRWRTLAVWVGTFMVVAVLVMNLYIQKEAYVETYRKESRLARLILEERAFHSEDGRVPVILLERRQALEYPRAQLMKALADEGSLSKGLAVMAFLMKRHFWEEYVTSSFHLDGFMMFGCCPNSASVTLDGYAKRLGVPRVPVYKMESPFTLVPDHSAYRIGYRDTEAWSKTPGSLRTIDYAKDSHQLFRLELDESFFQLRGDLKYRVVKAEGGPE